jgi:Uma2 family endonuclease
MATTRPAADDLWKTSGGDVRHELVDGDLVEMPRPGALRGVIAGRIRRRPAAHAETRGDAVMVAAGFVLDAPGARERVRGRDVSSGRRERLPEGRGPEKFFRGAPDVAVEILSPDDDPVEIQQQISDSLHAGTRRIRRVAPRASTVTVHRAGGSARRRREHEPLDGEDVPAGFGMRLAEPFA